jgi:hypothetical protein
MKKEVDELRTVVNEMDLVARQALGEVTSAGLEKELSRNMK